MPLMARSFTTPGVAQQLAWKTSMLARSGTVRMPVIYGVLTHEEHPVRMCCCWNDCAVCRSRRRRTPERWEQLKDQIVEGLLAGIGRIAAVALAP